MKAHVGTFAFAAVVFVGGMAAFADLSPLPALTAQPAAVALALSVPASCPNVSATLSLGSQGSEVTALQQYLIGQGFLAAGSASGAFDQATQDAVQEFQSEVGIVSSGTPLSTGWGVVGPMTRSALAHCDGLARDQKRMQDLASIEAAVASYKAANGSYPGAPTTYYWIDDNNFTGGPGGQCAAQTGGLSGYLANLCNFKDPQGKHYAFQQNGNTYTVAAAFETSLAQGAAFTYDGGSSVGGYYLSSGDSLQNPTITQRDVTASTSTAPSVNCATLLTTGYPMGGYGTDYYESGGNVVTVAEMKADGWNLDGITYTAKSDAYLNEVAAQGICTIYTPSAWNVNNPIATRIFNDGVFTAADEQTYLDIVRQQVGHVLSNSAWDASVSGWYISESNNESSAYMQLVADETSLIHQLDSKHRPVLTWAARTAPQGIGPIIQGTDGLINGYYIGYADQRSEFLFAAERAKQMQATYGASKLMLIAPPMCESTTDWQGQCGLAMGVWTSAQIQSYIGKFVRHDLYTLIASGMRGFLVFSLSDRVGFADFNTYYSAYKNVVSDLRTSGLYDALSNTTGSALSVTVTSGDATVGFSPSWDTSINETFPSVVARQFSYGGKTYVVVAYTGSGTVTATLSGMANGTYTDYIRGGTATASSNSMSVSVTGMDAAVFVSSASSGSLLQNGAVCTSASQCSSGYCYPGPESKNYCISRDANCAQPNTDGVNYGTNYTYNGLQYSCVYAQGLKSVSTTTIPTTSSLANGAVCTSASQCSSGYCYPGPESKNYCISRDANCAQPGTDGVAFGTAYTYNGLQYSCVYAQGLKQVSSPSSCSFNSASIANGTSVTAYQAASVPSGSACVSESRTCSNGTLSGSYAYSACSVQSGTNDAATRDATRQSDIGHIQAALASYLSANGSYPGVLDTYYWISDNNYATGNTCTSGGLAPYLVNLCNYKDSLSRPYAYERTSNGGYRLGAFFETAANQGTIFQYGSANTTVTGYYEYGSKP